jgi:hypothetical protein
VIIVQPAAAPPADAKITRTYVGPNNDYGQMSIELAPLPPAAAAHAITLVGEHAACVVTTSRDAVAIRSVGPDLAGALREPWQTGVWVDLAPCPADLRPGLAVPGAHESLRLVTVVETHRTEAGKLTTIEYGARGLPYRVLETWTESVRPAAREIRRGDRLVITVDHYQDASRFLVDGDHHYYVVLDGRARAL